MRRLGLVGLVLALGLSVGGSPQAATLELTGSFTQGGLVRGITVPGASVTLDGRPVLVSPDGDFVFGFGAHGAMISCASRGCQNDWR